jgi:geranylgeranyl pyrophosphate synthase
MLPGLCCQAAGGKLASTLEISAAWLLLYTAAHVFDTIEDGDLDPQVNKLGGGGPAINVANGLLLSAAIILNSLQKKNVSQELAGDMEADYLETILVMTSGQHLDLTNPQINLDQWWQIAGAKSGAFFSLACRSGAHLAKCDKVKVKAYSDFGFHLGLMLQILDDLEDFQTFLESRGNSNPGILQKTLAVAYADSVLAETEKNKLSQLILATSPQPEVEDEIIDLLDGCGAGLYMVAALERHYGLGNASLAEANPDPPAGERLDALIHSLKLN